MRISIVGAVLAVSSFCLCIVDAHAQNLGDCVKPWAVPDRWIDNHDVTEPIDQMWTPDDTFETVDSHGNPLPNPDVYVAPSPNGPGSGFTIQNDYGLFLTLKTGDVASGWRPGWFFAVDIGNAGAGGNSYRTAIATCTGTVTIGDFLSPLLGSLHGPTVQGTADLIALDPNAEWDGANEVIVNSCATTSLPCAAVSPRLVAVATFDPALYEQTRSNPGGPQLRVTNLIGVFIDGVVKGAVNGYLSALPGVVQGGQ